MIKNYLMKRRVASLVGIVLLLMSAISQRSYSQTYCTPTGGGSSTSYYVNNITTSNGLTNLAYAASSYTAYVNNSASSFSQVPGGSINVSLGAAGGGTFFYRCWVDWNNDGLFTTIGDTVFSTTSYAASPYTTGVINVPAAQPAGNYRVRFAISFSGAITSCGPAAYGNYVDYTLTVVALTPCTGQPNAGTAALSATSGSTGAAFTASVTGFTYGTGITYQWQQSANGTTGWAAIAGANSTTNTITAGATLGATTYYRLKTTCANSNDSNFSNNVSFTTAYCVPAAGSSSNSYYVNNITTTNGVTNLAYTATSFSAYVNNSASTFSQYPGGSVNISLGTAGGGTFYYRCWIDWNNDGLFTGTGETIFSTTAYTASPYTAGVINVPPTQAPGNYRVRFAISFSGAITACGPAASGNYVDYTLNVLTLPPCTGQPNAATASLSATSGVTAAAFTAQATGITLGSGIAYQWQQSPNGTSGWTSIAGANTITINLTASSTLGATTYYRLRTICASSNDSNFSNIVSFTTTYCTPAAGSSSTTYYINNVTTTNGLTNLAYTASSFVAYVNNAATTFSRIPGTTVNVSLGVSGTSTTTFYYRCWVDWDNDGAFTGTGETIFSTTTYTTSPYTVGVINIPATQASGNYRVRFAISYLGAITSCGPAAYGNYVDFTLVVVPPCTPPANLTATNITDVAATLSWPAITGVSGYQYAVDQTAANPTTGTATTNTSFNATGLTPDSTYYLHVRNNCVVSGFSAWTTISFKTCIAAAITPLSTTTFCTGGSVTLTGPTATSGSTYTYQWKVNGTNITTGGTGSSYNTSTSGNYTVAISNIVAGCTAQTAAATVVTVGTPPSSTIVPANAAGLCPFDSTRMVTNNFPGLDYQWYKNGVSIPGATDSVYKATTVGNYTVNVSSGPGCSTTSTIATAVNLWAQPIATITPAGGVPVICQGTSLALAGNLGSGNNYQWYLNNAAIGSATSINYTAATAGNYALKVTDANGCRDTAHVTLTTAPLPAATASPSVPTTACDSLALTANTGAGLQYQWSFNSATISGATGLVYKATATGNYLVTVKDANNCTKASTPVPVTINPSPVSIITYSSPVSFCEGGAVALNAYATSGTGLKYKWYRNGAVSSGDSNMVKVASQSGSYTVLVTNSFGCSRFSTPLTVQVNPIPNPPIFFLTFDTLTTLSNYVSYQWYVNGHEIDGANRYWYKSMQNGGYYVRVTDVNGCSNISPTYIVNSTGVHNYSQAAAQTSIYPNPASDVVNISAPVPVNVVLRDIQGKLVYSGNNVRQIDLHNFSDGLYMLMISDAEGTLLKVEKIQKTQQ